MKEPRDLDNALRELIRAEKGYVRDSRLSRQTQDDIKEFIEGFHHGCDGGIFLRLKTGQVQYLFIGELEDVEDMLLELIKTRLRRRKDA